MALSVLAQLGIGAGFGLLKRAFVDAPAEKRDRELRAVQASIAPFTGRGPQQAIQQGSALGEASTFALAALAQGQNIEQAKAANELQRARIKFLEQQAKTGEGGNDLKNRIVEPAGPPLGATASFNPFASIGRTA